MSVPISWQSTALGQSGGLTGKENDTKGTTVGVISDLSCQLRDQAIALLTLAGRMTHKRCVS